MTIEQQPKLFAVAHWPHTQKPHIVRTATQIFYFAKKAGASKKIMELIKEGYKLDTTGQTGADLEVAE